MASDNSGPYPDTGTFSMFVLWADLIGVLQGTEDRASSQSYNGLQSP